MPSLRTDFHALIGRAAGNLPKDFASTAYALYELADNLQTLVKGRCTLDEFRAAYTGEDDPKHIRGEKMPGERGYK